jgi:hypothetical protein
MMMPRRFVPLLVLVALALLAPLPSFAIGRDLATPRIAIPYNSGGQPVACTTGKGFLLGWGSASRPSGTTADAEGVPRLPASSMYPSSQQLFPNGDGCLALSQNGIAELDSSGAVRRDVAFGFGPQLFFAVAAFDGTNFFLIRGIVGEGWTGRLVDRNGQVLSTTTLPIDEYDPGPLAVTASADGGFTVFVAKLTAGVYTIRISAAGQITGTVHVRLGGERAYHASIATNAAVGRTVAAWTTSGPGPEYVHTVALNGGSAGPDVILPAGIERTSTIALLPSGDGFILLRNAYIDTPDQPRLLALRLDATGAPREASPTLLLNGTFAAAAATSRTLVVLSYTDRLNATLTEVSAAITDSGIVPAATYDVVATAVRQFNQVVASDGVDFFASWAEMTSTSSSLMAGRVTRSGVPLDGTGRVVAESVTPPTVWYDPSVAFGAGVYLVVFESALYRVMGQRSARDGTPIDPAPFVIAYNAGQPSVAFGGGRFLVAWRVINANFWVSLAGAMVGSDGSVGTAQLLTPAPSLALQEESPNAFGRPRIGWNGRHFIIASNRRLLRTSPLGTPIDAHTIGVPFPSGDSAIACSDQDCVLSFMSYYDLTGTADVYVIKTAVVHDDAALRTDAPKIVTNCYHASYAAIAFDGASYVLAWRSGDSLLGVARISRGGEPVVLATTGAFKAFPAAYPDTISDYPLSPPAVTANSAGDTAIVTTEFNTVWMIDRARFYLASEFSARRRAAL